jgi:hypothetical protein
MKTLSSLLLCFVCLPVFAQLLHIDHMQEACDFGKDKQHLFLIKKGFTLMPSSSEFDNEKGIYLFNSFKTKERLVLQYSLAYEAEGGHHVLIAYFFADKTQLERFNSSLKKDGFLYSKRNGCYIKRDGTYVSQTIIVPVDPDKSKAKIFKIQYVNHIGKEVMPIPPEMVH